MKSAWIYRSCCDNVINQISEICLYQMFRYTRFCCCWLCIVPLRTKRHTILSTTTKSSKTWRMLYHLFQLAINHQIVSLVAGIYIIHIFFAHILHLLHLLLVIIIPSVKMLCRHNRAVGKLEMLMAGAEKNTRFFSLSLFLSYHMSFYIYVCAEIIQPEKQMLEHTLHTWFSSRFFFV